MSQQLPQLEDLPDPAGKRVLLRADFNVPLVDGRIDDDLRIRAALPTIQWLLDHGAQVTACSHLGRPKGKPDPGTRWSRSARRLAELAPGVELLENLRFDPGEEANDPAFVDRLVEGQDLYVDDAFGAAHRAHASIVGPPARLPSAAGRVLANEVEVLDRLLHDAARPFVAVLGGSKVSDKLGVIEALLDRVDTLIVGGGMCFTFLAAQGHPVGRLAAGGGPDRGRAGSCWPAASEIVLPTDSPPSRPAASFGAGDAADRRGPPAGPRPARRAGSGLDIGPGHGGRVRRPDLGRPHRVLERADGRLRGPPLRGRAPARWPRRWPTAGASPWSAAATAPAPWPAFGLADRVDHVSTGGGARSSTSSRATCRAWGPAGGQAWLRQGRKPLISGNWKMHHNHLEAIAMVQKLSYLRAARRTTRTVDVSVHPPFTAPRGRSRRCSTPTASRSRSAPRTAIWEDRGAFTGEVSPAHAGQAGGRLRDRRPLRAPAALRRDRRVVDRKAARRPGRRA